MNLIGLSQSGFFKKQFEKDETQAIQGMKHEIYQNITVSKISPDIINTKTSDKTQLKNSSSTTTNEKDSAENGSFKNQFIIPCIVEYYNLIKSIITLDKELDHAIQMYVKMYDYVKEMVHVQEISELYPIFNELLLPEDFKSVIMKQREIVDRNDYFSLENDISITRFMELLNVLYDYTDIIAKAKQSTHIMEDMLDEFDRKCYENCNKN